MKALIQRVTEAEVTVASEPVGRIGKGLLVLLGVDRHDGSEQVAKLADKILGYRIFPDQSGRMNQSLNDINGGLLVVSQFTLSADTRKGTRPSFSSAAAPEDAQQLYREFVSYCEVRLEQVETGRFGADMQVRLINDGPVTFLLES